MLSGYWLVTDMDGTIVSTPSKAGGHYLPLTESRECLAPLTRWIERRGNLCVVSTAGKRMWKQVHAPLEAALRSKNAGKLAICGFSGAAFFLSGAEGEMFEDEEYRLSAVPGGTVIPPEAAAHIRVTSREVIARFLDEASSEPELIDALSKKYHEPYRALVEQLKDLGKERFMKEVLTFDRMLRHGEFLKETHDALIDVQTVPRSTDDPVVVQCTTLGIPMKYFDRFFPEPVVKSFIDYGLYVKRQPNSVVIAKKGVDKSTCVNWLGKRSNELNFDLSRALALGDIPKTIDFPLTQHPPMPFVSVSISPEDDPPGVLRVGQEELGTALLLEKIMDTAEADPEGTVKHGKLFDPDRLGRMCSELAVLGNRAAL